MTAVAISSQPAGSTALAASRRPDWKQEADSWLKNLQSTKTRQAYFDCWKGFVDFVATSFADEFPLGVSPEQVSKRHVIEWKHAMETTASPKTGKPVSQATMNQRLSALSSFFTWLVGRGLLEANPVDGVKRKAVSPYGKATWLDAELKQDVQLLAAVDLASQQGLRDRAILLLMLTLAVRVGVISQLKVSSLRQQGSKTFLTYTNKGGRVYEVETAPEAADAIFAYLQTRGPLAVDAPLFVATERGLRGRKAAEQPLTARAVHHLVTVYCDRVFGKGHGIHPHSLRHTAAQVAKEEGCSVTDISRLLKHGNLQVTTIYLHATDKADGKLARQLGRRYAVATA